MTTVAMTEDKADDPIVKVEMGEEDFQEDEALSALGQDLSKDVGHERIGDPCLFCLKDAQALKADNVEVPLLPGAERNNCVNEQLWALFILRQLLKYPQKKIANFLKKSGGVEIARWFSLCGECTQTVRAAMELYMKLVKLADEFKSFPREVASTIRSSFFKTEENSKIAGKHENYAGSEICREIREYFRQENEPKPNPKREDKGLSSRNGNTTKPHINENTLIKRGSEEAHARPCSNANDKLDNCQAPNDGNLYNPDIPRVTTAMDFQTDEGIIDAGDDWKIEADAVDEADPLYIPPSLIEVKSSGNKRPKRRRPKRNGIMIVKKLMNTQTGRRKSKQERRTYTFVDDDWPLVNASDEEEEEDPEKIKQSFLKLFPQTKKALTIPPNETETKIVEEEPLTKKTCLEPLASHTCHICDFKSQKEQGLIRHMKSSHNITMLNEIDNCLQNGVYSCPKCPAKYTIRHKFARHKVLHQRKGAYLNFTCEICNYVTVAGKALRIHLKREHNMRAQYSCDKCGKEFLYQPTLAKHKKEEHDSKEGGQGSSASPEKEVKKGGIHDHDTKKKKLACKICRCRRLFSNVIGLRAHMRDHKTCKTPCPKCKYPCRGATALEVHLKRNLCNRKYEYECKSCKFKTERRYEYEAHRQMHLVEKAEFMDTDKDKESPAEVEKKDGCNSGDLTATKVSELNQHKSTQSVEEKTYICESCPYQTKCNADFDNHVERHKVFDKSENIDGKLKCTICGFLFDGQITFEKHMRKVHSSELELRSFQCSMCDKHFAREYNLKCHVAQVHTKQCKFFCEICGFEAMKPSTLDIHMLSHSEEKNFVCDLCGSGVKTRDTLKKHMDTCHPDGGNGINTDRFKCKYCTTHEDVTFPTRILRNEHIRNSHKDLYVHKCDQCGNTYCSVASLQLHKKTSHAGAAEEAECRFCHVKVSSRFYLYSHYKYCQKYKFSKSK